MAGPPSRLGVNIFLAGFLAVLAIDAFHSIGPTHQALQEAIDTPLDLTGLWQGPWRLYAPDVDKLNLRLRAEIVFADQAVATWSAPDWVQRSAVQKFLAARHINYLNSVLLAGKELEWNALCAFLARSVPHPQGKAVNVVEVKLLLRGARVPPPSERVVPARPYVEFDPWEPIWAWRPSG